MPLHVNLFHRVINSSTACLFADECTQGRELQLRRCMAASKKTMHACTREAGVQCMLMHGTVRRHPVCGTGV
jgi:hypothetical protein